MAAGETDLFATERQVLAQSALIGTHTSLLTDVSNLVLEALKGPRVEKVHGL